MPTLTMRHWTVYFHDHLMTARIEQRGVCLFFHALTSPPVFGAFFSLHHRVFVMSKQVLQNYNSEAGN